MDENSATGSDVITIVAQRSNGQPTKSMQYKLFSSTMEGALEIEPNTGTPVEKILKLSKTFDNSSKDHCNPIYIENYAKISINYRKFQKKKPNYKKHRNSREIS